MEEESSGFHVITLEYKEPKERKAKEAVKVSFTKEGHHYLYGLNGIPNFKFEATLELVECFKSDKIYLVEWKDIKTNKKYYSHMGLLNDSLAGKSGSIVKGIGLQVKDTYTFQKVGNATVLISRTKYYQ